MPRILYGYRMTENGIIADSDTASRIRNLFELYSSDMSMRKASETARIELQINQVKHLLENRTYTGNEIFPCIVSEKLFDKAQQESESLSRNVLLGLQFRYQSGQVMVNYSRFLGYTREKKGGPLIIVPEEAAVVRRIYREYLEGQSLHSIARGLEADGIKTGAGNTRWHDTGVHKILTNEKYMGRCASAENLYCKHA